MRSIRSLSLVVAVLALVVAPLSQSSVEAQGRPAVRRAYYSDTASMRLQVTPRETEVYVDGYYAGTVDDFDGMFQRLEVEPGEHELTLYLQGYRAITQKIFLQDRGTFRIRQAMTPLAAGEPQDARPVSAPRQSASTRAPADPRDPRPAQNPRDRDRDRDRERVRGDAGFGAIAVRVQPADADVLIDGERWEGPRGDEALVVQVAPGPHRLEVRKGGYRSYTADVTVTAAQTSPLNISLPRQ